MMLPDDANLFDNQASDEVKGAKKKKRCQLNEIK
jgi:hypothetical protein